MNAMLHETRQLVGEVIELTGACPPEILDAGAPVLSEPVLTGSQGQRFYLVGLIGGKNVGKSSLVNALVGSEITARSGYGPGTEKVVAYAHETQAEGLREMLDREVPGRCEIVTHSTPGLTRQVLLDLPDVDSYYEFHRDITKRMLRHMLFPVWIQSVEKYADSKPRELLAMVTAGNDPRNFVFCLNKIDQVIAREGHEVARELRDEYASRLSAALGIAPPRVWMISAIHRDQGELPALRALLAREKSPETVSRSQQRAARQHAASLLWWVEQQHLGRRLDRLDRLQSEAQEEVMERIGGPLIERITSGLMGDPSLRMTLADEGMQQRVARWPIVNILHVVLEPITSVLRHRLSLPQQRALESTEGLVERYLGDEERSLSTQVQVTFARLQQSHPQMSHLYRDGGLWDRTSADRAVSGLRQRLAGTIERQRAALRLQMAGGGGTVGWLGRVLITLGAAIWFPFVQPVLEAYLSPGGMSDFALLAVQVLGVSYLLKNVAFLAVYFVLVWLCVKWAVRRRVARWLERLNTDAHLDPALSLSGQTLEWTAHLLDPIRRAREQTESIVRRAGELRAELDASAGRSTAA